MKNEKIAEMDKCIHCLALELPESVHKDICRIWNNLRKEINGAELIAPPIQQASVADLTAAAWNDYVKWFISWNSCSDIAKDEKAEHFFKEGYSRAANMR